MGNRFSAECPFRGSSADAEERALAIIALFNWKVEGDGEGRINARTSMSAFGRGEYVTLSFLKGNRMFVESESVSAFQFFDFGKNRNNVEKFIEAFRDRKLPLEEKERSFLDRYFSGR
ncbi:MAG TPA: DUF1499 domain-containing protein [Pyrinomonadaceae bacterium]|nr:DUF1499 domain-containing protein [Pyrinomonadaceae bacterium]